MHPQIGDTETLSKHIRRNGSDAVYYQTHPELKLEEEHGKEWIVHHTNSDLLERFKYYDLLGPAKYYIQQKINQQMKGHISQRLLWNHERDKLNLYSVPDSLIAALWLQFGQSINGERGLSPTGQNVGNWTFGQNLQTKQKRPHPTTHKGLDVL